MCKNPRNGTNWGFLHNKEVHHNFCETCKDNLDKKSGDLCPLCDSPIDLIVKMFDLFYIKLNYSTLMGLDNTYKYKRFSKF